MNSQKNQGDHYVVDGAVFKCQYGSTPCQIAVTSNQKVKAQGKAVVTDKEVNFKVPSCTFGNCSMNPSKQAPICNYANGMWISNTTLKHGTNNAVTESSKMKCPIYSGEISCVYHGQTQCVSIDDFKNLGLEKLAFSPFATVFKFPDGDKLKKNIVPINSVSASREYIRTNDIVTLHAYKKGNKELTATEFCNWIVTTRKSLKDGENNKTSYLDKMTIYKTVTSPFNIILNEPGIYHLECGSDNMINYYVGSKSFVPTRTKKTAFDYQKPIGANNMLPFDKTCKTTIEVLKSNRILDVELKGEYSKDTDHTDRYFVEKDKEIEIIVTTAVPLDKNESLCLFVNNIQTTNKATSITDNKYSFKFKTSGFNSHIEKHINIILKDYTDITGYLIPFDYGLTKSEKKEKSYCKSLTIKVIEGYVSATISLDEKGLKPVKDKIRPNTPIFMAVRPTDKSSDIKDLHKAVWRIEENKITSSFHGNLLLHNFKREGNVKITVDLSSCDVAIKDNKLTHSFTVARNKITGIKKSTPKIFYPNINYRIELDFLYDDYNRLQDGSFSYLLDGEEKEIDYKEINVIFSKEELGKHYLYISKDVALDLDVKEAQIERWQFVDNNRNKISEVGFDEPFFLDIDVPAWKDLNQKELTDQVRLCLWDKKAPIAASCLKDARINPNGQTHIKLIISKDDINVDKREKINIIASLINPPYTNLKNMSQMPGQNGHWICSNMPISDQISMMLTLTTTPCITGYFSGKSCNPQKSVMKYGDSIYIILSTHNCKEMMDKITVELYENNKVGDDDTLISTYDNLQADEYGKVKIDISDKFADEESHGNNPNPRLFYFKVRSGADVVYSYPQTQEDVFNMTYRKECDECNTAVVEFDGETHTVTTSDSKAVTKVRSYLWQLKVGKDKEIERLNRTLAMMAPVVVGEELRKGEKLDKNTRCFCHRDFTVEEVFHFIKMLRSDIKMKNKDNGKEEQCYPSIKSINDNIWEKSQNIDKKDMVSFTNELNASFKKYGINKCIQKITFLAQAVCETGCFLNSEETIHDTSYDGFKGRGLLQLTKRTVYETYNQRVVGVNILEDKSFIGRNLHYIVDSGATFFTNRNFCHDYKWDKNSKSLVIRKRAEKFKESVAINYILTLNKLCLLMEKYDEETYFFLISKLLNGYPKDQVDEYPNGWDVRKSAFEILKKAFKYDKYVCKEVEIDFPIHNTGWHDPLDVMQICAYQQSGGLGPYNASFHYRGSRPHQGVDLFAKLNTPIYACLDGRIVSASAVGDYGNVIVLAIYEESQVQIFKNRRKKNFEPYFPDEYTDGPGFNKDSDFFYLAYAHLSSFCVIEGDEVKAGDIIGYSGETGNAKGTKGPHVHFEVRSAQSCGRGMNNRCNPSLYFDYEQYMPIAYDQNKKIKIVSHSLLKDYGIKVSKVEIKHIDGSVSTIDKNDFEVDSNDQYCYKRDKK